MRILLVDDHATLRRGVRRQLEAMLESAVVDEAGDGAAALERLRVERYDLVVTDNDMPGLGGFELLSAVRKDGRLRGVPVLMVTAEARRDEIVRANAEGAIGYLVKPFTRETLEQRLRRSLPRLFEPAEVEAPTGLAAAFESEPEAAARSASASPCASSSASRSE